MRKANVKWMTSRRGRRRCAEDYYGRLCTRGQVVSVGELAENPVGGPVNSVVESDKARRIEVQLANLRMSKISHNSSTSVLQSLLILHILCHLRFRTSELGLQPLLRHWPSKCGATFTLTPAVALDRTAWQG